MSVAEPNIAELEAKLEAARDRTGAYRSRRRSPDYDPVEAARLAAEAYEDWSRLMEARRGA